MAERAIKAVAAPDSLPVPDSSSGAATLSHMPDLPKFRRGFGWAPTTPEDPRRLSPAALSTETAAPLPMPPEHLLNNAEVKEALHRYSDAIRVETPFDVDRLEGLLSSHPNRPFVDSVIWSLRNGFWPLDESEWKVETNDFVGNYSMDPPDLEALRAFRDKEVHAGRWSKPIDELLPYMKISPMFVVWQNDKARVVADHSASRLNAGIPRSGARVRYDNMHDFAQVLYNLRQQNPDKRYVLWKSDVSSAFLNLPAHPLWQLRQVVIVEGHLYIVRRLVFGNRFSPRAWCSVSALLAWIAGSVFKIYDLEVYMDDFWGLDDDGHLVWFHHAFRPYNQVMLLLFWDIIHCPYEDKKQLHGNPLKIIGFWVDANLGTISIPPSAINDAIAAIDTFLATTSRQPILREWARLSGYLNWVLNVFPWGRPALTEIYRKLSGKSHFYAPVFINAEVVTDLTWFKLTMPKAIGVRLSEVALWPDESADIVINTDATLTSAISFVYSNQAFIYQIQPPPTLPFSVKPDIFFFEQLAILSAIHHCASLPSPPRHLLIYSDSLDSVYAFNTLSVTKSIHNAVLMATAGIVASTGIDFRIRHISGKTNIRANLLSRLLLEEYSHRYPADRVRLFSPPRELLPARWRACF